MKPAPRQMTGGGLHVADTQGGYFFVPFNDPTTSLLEVPTRQLMVRSFSEVHVSLVG